MKKAGELIREALEKAVYYEMSFIESCAVSAETNENDRKAVEASEKFIKDCKIYYANRFGEKLTCNMYT